MKLWVDERIVEGPRRKLGRPGPLRLERTEEWVTDEEYKKRLLIETENFRRAADACLCRQRELAKIPSLRNPWPRVCRQCGRPDDQGDLFWQ